MDTRVLTFEIIARASTSVGTSFVISLLIVGALFSALMAYRDELASSDHGRLLGGFLSSLIYLFTLTVILS